MAAPMGWWGKYCGIPFREFGADPERDGGLNCWCLVRWIYQHELGISLPTYLEDVDQSVDLESQLPALNAAFVAGAQSWAPVPAGQHKPFDVVLMRRGHHACHVGIVTKPREGRMLHIEHGIMACLEDYATGYWARRVVGVYRHA